MKDLKSALLLFFLLTVICGGLYPAVVTGVAAVVFPHQAQGSFITGANGREIGSALIGQPFSDPKYLWPRPSTTPDSAYNPAGSGGSNAGPTNPAYLQTVAYRVKSLRSAGISGTIPAEMVQASASGLDPHISPAAALMQVPRIARARNLSEEELQRIVAVHTENRLLGIFGESRVNVLAVNGVLDKLTP
ncbi:MAG: potassium-transporting ATPase subunit KdpC [Geobacter sp.]|nr:potassium-transporting ATPase subunit KdpC [Geobacter sp.]